MKNNGQKNEAEEDLPQSALTQPSPDNQGIEMKKIQKMLMKRRLKLIGMFRHY